MVKTPAVAKYYNNTHTHTHTHTLTHEVTKKGGIEIVAEIRTFDILSSIDSIHTVN